MCARAACWGGAEHASPRILKSPPVWISLIVVVVAATMPLYVSGYVLGLLTIAYYFGVFSMAWDLLFGFANEVNFGPTFLIGLGAYTAGILDSLYQPPISLCIAAGVLAAMTGGVVLALPALRVRGPYFGLTTLVAVLMLQNFVVVAASLTGGEIGLDRARRHLDRRQGQLLDRARLHGRERRHALWALALAGRPDPAGERSGCGAGRRARLQRRQAQARGVPGQRVLFRPRRRADGVLSRRRLGRHLRRRHRRRAGDHRRGARRAAHDPRRRRWARCS